MRDKETSLADRLSTAAKAKQILLEKARAKAAHNDPGFAERQAARHVAAIEREARAAERKKAKLADAAREAAERVAAEDARLRALEAEQEAKKMEAIERAAREVAAEAERKAARDARYAARKARKK
ncbi:DUF6481 family protein [Dongia soli]|uniref:DUF6481 family protein n=1 Tax=Dongia soli TaxID=600628 RepID=A0ABU5EFH8_9PROT|nr:DUF6481 family protein [Dongia soli]MDY0884966.1 DUF6481 family protein [Dongia soli]